MNVPTVRGLREVIAGSALYAASAGLLSASKFLLIPLYTHYLTPEQYGFLGILTAISGFIAILLTLGLDEAVAREYYDYQGKPSDLRCYLSTVLLFMAALSAVVGMALFVIGPPVIEGLFPARKIPFSPYFPLVLGIASTTSFLGVFMTLLRVRHRAAAYGLAQITRFILMVGITLVLLMVFKLGVEGALWGEFISTAVVSIVLAYFQFAGLWRKDVLNVQRDIWVSVAHFWRSERNVRVRCTELEVISKPGFAVNKGRSVAHIWVLKQLLAKAVTRMFNHHKFRGTLAYAIPLLPYALANWVTSASDRLILAKFRTMEEVGLYTLGYSLAMGINVLVVSAIHSAYLPYFFETAKNFPKAQGVFARNIEYYVMGVGVVCLLGMLFSREFLALLAPATYAEAQSVVAIVILAFLFLGLYLMTALPLFYLKKTRQVAMISLTAAAVNVSLNFVVVPMAGAVGAAWTTLAAYAIMFVLAYKAANKIYPIGYRMGRVWGMIALVAVLGLVLQSQPIVLKATALGAFVAFVAVAMCIGQRNYKLGTVIPIDRDSIQ